jgi:hypothetical protein
MLQRITPMPPDFVCAAAAPVQPGVLGGKVCMGFSGRQSRRIAMRQVARLVNENARGSPSRLYQTVKSSRQARAAPACE